MRCIICDAATGDACVPLCEAHMQLAEVAGMVELGDLSDWPYETVGHIELMCDDPAVTAHFIRREMSQSGD